MKRVKNVYSRQMIQGENQINCKNGSKNNFGLNGVLFSSRFKIKDKKQRNGKLCEDEKAGRGVKRGNKGIKLPRTGSGKYFQNINGQNNIQQI